MNTLENTFNCKILITSVLDEKWSDIICKLSKNEIIIFHKSYIPPNLRNKSLHSKFESEKLEKTSVLSISNITTISKDPDILSIRIDTNQGYYQIKLSLSDYSSFLSYIEQFKHIVFQYRTKDQDKNYN